MWIGCNVFVLVPDVNFGDHDLAWDYRLLARQLVLRDKASSLGLVERRSRTKVRQHRSRFDSEYCFYTSLDTAAPLYPTPDLTDTES